MSTAQKAIARHNHSRVNFAYFSRSFAMECVLAEVKAIKQSYNSNETPIPLSRNASNAITTEPVFTILLCATEPSTPIVDVNWIFDTFSKNHQPRTLGIVFFHEHHIWNFLLQPTSFSISNSPTTLNALFNYCFSQRGDFSTIRAKEQKPTKIRSKSNNF